MYGMESVGKWGGSVSAWGVWVECGERREGMDRVRKWIYGTSMPAANTSAKCAEQLRSFATRMNSTVHTFFPIRSMSASNAFVSRCQKQL